MSVHRGIYGHFSNWSLVKARKKKNKFLLTAIMRNVGDTGYRDRKCLHTVLTTNALPLVFLWPTFIIWTFSLFTYSILLEPNPCECWGIAALHLNRRSTECSHCLRNGPIRTFVFALQTATLSRHSTLNRHHIGSLTRRHNSVNLPWLCPWRKHWIPYPLTRLPMPEHSNSPSGWMRAIISQLITAEFCSAASSKAICRHRGGSQGFFFLLLFLYF